VLKKPSFKCKTCDGPTEHVWTSGDGKVVGLQCVNGHYERSKGGKGPAVLMRPVFLVPAEEA